MNSKRRRKNKMNNNKITNHKTKLLAKLFIFGIMSVFILALIANISLASAEFDTTINAKLNNEDTDFYIQTDSSSGPGLDYLDFEVRSYPSGNYSFLYAVTEGSDLIIHSFNLSRMPQTFNLVYEVSPAQAGTLALSWNTNSEQYYTLTLYDYGTDSSRTTLVDTIKMGAVSSYSASHISATKRYFKITANNATCGDGVKNQGELGTDCGGPCANSCPRGPSSCISECVSGAKKCSGNGVQVCALSSDGCNKWGAITSCKTGETCSNGVCVPTDCSCAALTCEGETCNNGLCPGTLKANCIGRGCGTAPNGCGSCGSCNEGFRCEDGDCFLIPLECKSNSECSDGYSCIAGNCICSSETCKSEIEKPKEIPENILKISDESCSSDFACDSWSECNAQYEMSGLITGSDIKGERTRECKDKNSCYANFKEIKECSLKEEITVSTTTWCNQELTEIKNLKGNILARLKTLPTGKFVAVDLNVETEGYCYYCYNGIQDNDETDIDCGGPTCQSCEKKKEAFSKSYLYVFNFVKAWIILFALIFAVLLALLIVLFKKLYLELRNYIRHKRAMKKVLVKIPHHMPHHLHSSEHLKHYFHKDHHARPNHKK